MKSGLVVLGVVKPDFVRLGLLKLGLLKPRLVKSSRMTLGLVEPGHRRSGCAMQTTPPSETAVDCRPGCGACCIAPSIASPLPGMPHGKPAGIPCVQLDDTYRCRLFGRPERPAFCARLRPQADMCGEHREDAMEILSVLEMRTRP